MAVAKRPVPLSVMVYWKVTVPYQVAFGVKVNVPLGWTGVSVPAAASLSVVGQQLARHRLVEASREGVVDGCGRLRRRDGDGDLCGRLVRRHAVGRFCRVDAVRIARERSAGRVRLGSQRGPARQEGAARL